MYETLIRQHDMTTYSMQSIDDAISKLKAIESKKISRRQYQVAMHKQQQQKDEKRKADELDDPEEGPIKRLKEDAAVTAPSGTVTPELTTSPASPPPVIEAFKADSDARGTPEATAVSSSVPGSADVSARPSPAPAQLGKKMVPQEQRFTSSRPAPQVRGHTSYLTFAFLLPTA